MKIGDIAFKIGDIICYALIGIFMLGVLEITFLGWQEMSPLERENYIQMLQQWE